MPDDSTHLGDLPVPGQRRKPSGDFPTRGGNEGGVHQNEVGENPNPEPPVQADPCSAPSTALPWNADAAGAKAVADFLAKAGEIGSADAPNGVPDLLNREFGAFLRSAGSTVATGPVSPGNVRDRSDPNWVSTLTIDPVGTNVANYHGDVHSHPNGNPLPSEEDWNGFMDNNYEARRSGRTDVTFYLYIIVVDQNGAPPTIRVYEDRPRAAGSSNPPRPTTVGPEVNPEAQPCP